MKLVVLKNSLNGASLGDPMREKQFENQVKDFLKKEGCWFLKTWSNGVQRQGVPDLLICCNGYFVGVELKNETGTPSDLQIWNIEKIRKSLGFAFILYPSGFDKFKCFIHDLKHNKFTREMEVDMK